MSEAPAAAPVTVAAPAQATPAAPAPAAPVRGAPLGKASDLARELEAAKPAPVEATPAAETPDELTAKRLARIAATNARERAAIAAERAKFQAESKETAEAAGKWKALQEAKGKGDQLAVLRQMYSDDEITQGLYQRLTDHIYNSSPAETLTRADVAALVEQQAKKLEADRVAAAEAERKAAEEKVTTGVSTAEVNYLDTIDKTFAVVAAKFPWTKAFPPTGTEIVAHIREQMKATGAVPMPEEIFAHFEKERSSRIPGAREQEPQPTITRGWKNDAPPTGARSIDLKESLELAKREVLGK